VPWRLPWRRKLGARQRLIIYPEVLPLTRPLRSGLPAGTLPTRDQVYEDITRYRSLREYVRGDDARRINWKVSARMAPWLDLVVNVLEESLFSTHVVDARRVAAHLAAIDELRQSPAALSA